MSSNVFRLFFWRRLDPSEESKSFKVHFRFRDVLNGEDIAECFNKRTREQKQPLTFIEELRIPAHWKIDEISFSDRLEDDSNADDVKSNLK